MFSAIEGDPSPSEGGDVTFQFTHPSAGTGEVTLHLTPNGFIPTRGASNSPEIYEAPQYIVTKTREEPDGILARIAQSQFTGSV